MPGLSLRADQVQRLCGLDHATCVNVLEQLVERGFLTVRPDGSFTRARNSDISRIGPAKAHLPAELTRRNTRFRDMA